ncbi:unnamed protein product [Rhizophagus irregularis]|nr:unnamed protein product [Rhizophagus irregularis]
MALQHSAARIKRRKQRERKSPPRVLLGSEVTHSIFAQKSNQSYSPLRALSRNIYLNIRSEITTFRESSLLKSLYVLHGQK